MLGPHALVGREVLLATKDHFVANYIASGLQYWGVEILGPVETIPDLLRLATKHERSVLACISVNLPGVNASLEQTLRQHAFPCMLFGVPMSGTA